jgi:hypothetical protein
MQSIDGSSKKIIAEYWNFVFVSCFDIRISNFSCPKNTHTTTKGLLRCINRVALLFYLVKRYPRLFRVTAYPVTAPVIQDCPEFVHVAV